MFIPNPYAFNDNLLTLEFQMATHSQSFLSKREKINFATYNNYTGYKV